MKKNAVKKLVLAKETVRALADVASVKGGFDINTQTSCRPYYCQREDSDHVCGTA